MKLSIINIFIHQLFNIHISYRHLSFIKVIKHPRWTSTILEVTKYRHKKLRRRILHQKEKTSEDLPDIDDPYRLRESLVHVDFQVGNILLCSCISWKNNHSVIYIQDCLVSLFLFEFSPKFSSDLSETDDKYELKYFYFEVRHQSQSFSAENYIHSQKTQNSEKFSNLISDVLIAKTSLIRKFSVICHPIRAFIYSWYAPLES